MIKKILKKDNPEFFEDLDFIDRSYEEHRKASNFYTQSIVEIKKEWYGHIKDIEKYEGFWETNVYISDTVYGSNFEEITELTRVEKAERTIKEEYWKEI